MQITHIRVTNNNEFPISDRFDGIHYLFESGKPRLLPLEAAALIFGLPVDDNGMFEMDASGDLQPDWAYVQRRWGWNTVNRKKDEEMAEAVDRTMLEIRERCANLILEAVSMALREVVREPEPLPEPRDDAEGEDGAKTASGSRKHGR